MTDAFDPYLPQLHEALNILGMSGDIPRAPLMLDYLRHLRHWNHTYNLTALCDPWRMLVQHVFDSLAVVPVLRQYRDGRDTIMLDVGSGAGLPGIIVGICEPRWTIYCVDTVAKKTAFMRHAAGVLGLPNVHPVRGRVESLPGVQADIVISRAFASLTDFVDAASHHLSATGVLLAMKGHYPDDECRALQAHTGWRARPPILLKVPQLDAQRCLVELAKEDS